MTETGETAVERSIDAVNSLDRDRWLDCYTTDVVWEIVGGTITQGRDAMTGLWDAMVVGGSSRHRVAPVVAGSGAVVAAVVAHDGEADGIVVCRLDPAGRIAASRSYRTAQDDPDAGARRELGEAVRRWASQHRTDAIHEVALLLGAGDLAVAHVLVEDHNGERRDVLVERRNATAGAGTRVDVYVAG